jgi:methionyl-tRNA synthetase
MLMGSGFRTPTSIFVHGFLTVNGEKMSKSRGTFIKAETYLRHLDPQYLRFYYASKLGPGIDDLDFSSDDFVNRVNADLVNKIVNIPSRTMAIIHKHGGGRLTSVDNEGRELIAGLLFHRDAVARHYEDRELARVTLLLAQLAGQINDYLQAHSPWNVVKGDPAYAVVICTSALNAFKVLATFIKPILPRFSDRFAELLEIPPLSWSRLDQLVEQKTVRPYQHLVQRMDRDKVAAMMDDSRESLGAELQTLAAPAMTLDPLVDCDFRTMRVVAAAPVAGSEQLVALSLETNGQSREVLAGLDPTIDNLINRILIALPNLEPRKLMGRESHGMIVGAKSAETTTPVFLPDDQENGILD